MRNCEGETREAPLGYEWVCGEIARIVKRYGLNVVVGDQHCAEIIKQHFSKLGITYKELTFGSETRGDVFGNLKHLLFQKKLLLLDKPEELRQFRSLEEHRATRGSIEIRPAHGSKNDLAVVIRLVTLQLSKVDAEPGAFLCLDDHPRVWVDPRTCARAAICANWPACMDEGYCVGFRG